MRKGALPKVLLTLFVVLIWIAAGLQLWKGIGPKKDFTKIETVNPVERQMPKIDWKNLNDPFWVVTGSKVVVVSSAKNRQPGIRLKGIVDEKALVENMDEPGQTRMLGPGEFSGKTLIREVLKDHVRVEREKSRFKVYLDRWEYDE